MPVLRRFSLARVLALVLLVCGAIAAAVLGARLYTEPSASEANRMVSLFGKKKKPASTTIHPSVGSALQPIDEYPADLDAPRAVTGATCSKVRVDGAPPSATFTAGGAVEASHTGYIVRGLANRAPFLIVNNSTESRFELWNLDAGSPPRILDLQPLPALQADQAEWLQYFVFDAACLTSSQLLLAVGYFDPRRKNALYLLHGESGGFQLISEVDSDTRDLGKFFEIRPVSPDTALALYYTRRTRQSAEIYHNYFNHLMLFSPAHPQGMEIATIGIDVGNVRRWDVADGTLYLHTVDARNKRPKERNFSLDLSPLF